MKLYIGNLPHSLTEDGLRDLFSSLGEIKSANLILDRYTGQSRGFGFVEYKNKQDAEKAIKELNGSEVEGRKILVNEARPQEKREGVRGPGGGSRNGGPGNFRR